MSTLTHAREFSTADFMLNLLSRNNDKEDEDISDKNVMEHKKPYLKHCQHCIEEIVKVCSRGRNCVSKSVKKKAFFIAYLYSYIRELFEKISNDFRPFLFSQKVSSQKSDQVFNAPAYTSKFFCTAMQIVWQIFLNLLLVLLILFIPHYIYSRQA